MSAWHRARGLYDKAASGLRKAGDKYSSFAEQAVRPLMRAYDANLMSPGDRAGLVFSQRQGTTLNPSDQNLIGRLMISDPNDAAANALLADNSFASALGTTTEELLKQRRQTLEAVSLADRIQTAAPPNPTTLYGSTFTNNLAEAQRVTSLLKAARADSSNENVTRLLEAIANPQVVRPSNPQAWDAQAEIDVPTNQDFQNRMGSSPTYLNPNTGQRVKRNPMPVPPGDQFQQQESLSTFLNRAYPPLESTTRLGELESKATAAGGFNRDFSDTLADDTNSYGAQAFRELNQLRTAMQGVEDLGLTAAERLGYTSVAERLRKAEGLKGRSKIHDSEGGLQPIALSRISEAQQKLKRPLTKQERARVLNELNDELPDAAFALGLGALDKETKNLRPRRFAADVLAAADRAGYQAVNVPNVESAGLRQPKYAYISDDAQALNRLITNPTTGAVIGSTALLGTALAINAAINNQRKDDLKFNRDVTGHEAFSKTIPQEVNYVLKTTDPDVLSEILNQ